MIHEQTRHCILLYLVLRKVEKILYEVKFEENIIRFSLNIITIVLTILTIMY